MFPTVSIRWMVARAALLAALLVTGCVAAPLPPATLPAITATLPATTALRATATPPPQPSATPGGTEITLAAGDLANTLQYEEIAAVEPDEEHPYWEILPAHRRLTLLGYPLPPGHIHQPRIYVYPVDQLARYNETAAALATDLQTLLDQRSPGAVLPLLPLFNAAQVFHAQVKFLDFQNGRGVRFLTHYAQGLVPANNQELFYTFQGLTSDGRYYVAAILPLAHPNLPATGLLTQEQYDQIGDFAVYTNGVAAMLEAQPADSFSPSLSALDALVQSLQVPE